LISLARFLLDQLFLTVCLVRVMTSTGISLNIPDFNGRNGAVVASALTLFLKAQKLSLVLQARPAENPARAEWDASTDQALSLLILRLPLRFQASFLSLTSVSAFLTKLKTFSPSLSLYEARKSLASEKVTKSYTSFLVDFGIALDAFTAAGGQLNREEHIFMLLDAIPQDDYHFRDLIEQRPDFPTLEVAVLENVMRTRDARRKPPSSSPPAMAVQPPMVPVVCQLCHKKGHEASTCRVKKPSTQVSSTSPAAQVSRSPSSGPFKGTCNYCHKKGHKAVDCFKKQRADAKKLAAPVVADPVSSSSAVDRLVVPVLPSNPQSFVLSATGTFSPSGLDPRRVQVALGIDSLCFEYLVSNREWLHNYSDLTPSECFSVKVANDSVTTPVVGKGSILVEAAGRFIEFNEVFYSPHLGTDLFLVSVGKLTNSGSLGVYFGPAGKSYIFDPITGNSLFSLRQSGHLYWWDVTLHLPHSAVSVPSIDTSHAHSSGGVSLPLTMKVSPVSFPTLHGRLAHINERSIRKTLPQVLGLHLQPEDHPVHLTRDSCEHCRMGKLTRLSFAGNGTDISSLRPLELLTYDGKGPISPATPSGERYVYTYLDPATHYRFVYLAAKKSEQIFNLQRTLTFIATQTPHKVKTLRSDRGGENMSNAEKALAAEYGLKVERAPTGVHQLNSFPERDFRTMFDLIRTVMLASFLPTSLWFLALYFVVYVLNRTVPTRSTSYKTPYELVYNKKPSLHHLRVFGCSCLYRLLDKNRVDDISPPAALGIYVGVPVDGPGFLVLTIPDFRLIVSRDVIFDESTMGVTVMRQKGIPFPDKFPQDTLDVPLIYNSETEAASNLISNDGSVFLPLNPGPAVDVPPPPLRALEQVANQAPRRSSRIPRPTGTPWVNGPTGDHTGSFAVAGDSKQDSPYDRSDWKLNPKLFQQACEWHGVFPSMDLFASVENKQVDKFCTEDAFQLNWGTLTDILWINPPFNIIDKVVNKLLLDSFLGTALIVTPKVPSAPWFPKLLACMIGVPFELPSSPDVFLPVSSYHKRGVGQPPFDCLVWHFCVRKPRSVRAFMTDLSGDDLPALIEDSDSDVDDDNNPSYKYATTSSSEIREWQQAMDEEIASLRDCGVFEEVPQTQGMTPVGSRWVLTKKFKADGTFDKHKARVVAKGYNQQYLRDYEETYAPVVNWNSFLLLFTLSIFLGASIAVFDIKTAFLNGDIDFVVYMRPPPGYARRGYVWLLKKALYGLKQASRCWNSALHDALKAFGLRRLESDRCVYILFDTLTSFLILAIHVDDITIFFKNDDNVRRLYDHLSRYFTVKNLGFPSSLLSLEIIPLASGNGYILRQQGFLKSFLARLQPTKPRSIPMPPGTSLAKCMDNTIIQKYQNLFRRCVGSTSWSASRTRPDYAYSVNYLSRFQQSCDESHMKVMNHLIGYIQATQDFGLILELAPDAAPILEMYVDSDFAGDQMDSKSTGGWIITFAGMPVLWKVSKQNVVARSTTEAEYIAAASGFADLQFLVMVLEELDIIPVHKPITVYEDNAGALNLSKNPNYGKRTRHIALRHHILRDGVENGIIKLHPVPTLQQVADIFTKALPENKFNEFRRQLGVKPV
jgi:hypothetical protein